MHTKSHLCPTLTGRSAVIYLLAVLPQTAALSQPGVSVAGGALTWDSPRWVTSLCVTLLFRPLKLLPPPPASRQRWCVWVCMSNRAMKEEKLNPVSTAGSSVSLFFHYTKLRRECVCVCCCCWWFFFFFQDEPESCRISESPGTIIVLRCFSTKSRGTWIPRLCSGVNPLTISPMTLCNFFRVQTRARVLVGFVNFSTSLCCFIGQ